MEKSGFRRIVNRGYSYNYFVVLSPSRIAFAIRFAPTQNTGTIRYQSRRSFPDSADCGNFSEAGYGSLPVVTNNSSPTNAAQVTQHIGSLAMPTTFPF